MTTVSCKLKLKSLDKSRSRNIIVEFCSLFKISFENENCKWVGFQLIEHKFKKELKKIKKFCISF